MCDMFSWDAAKSNERNIWTVSICKKKREKVKLRPHLITSDIFTVTNDHLHPIRLSNYHLNSSGR